MDVTDSESIHIVKEALNDALIKMGISTMY